jgi:predicted nucleotidyltransferase
MLAKHTMAVMFSKAGKKMESVFTSMNISSAPSIRYVLNNAKLSRGGVKISSATGRGIKSRNSARGLMQRMLSLLKEIRYVFTFFQTVNRQRDSENGRPRQDGINDRLRRCCQQHRFS